MFERIYRADETLPYQVFDGNVSRDPYTFNNILLRASGYPFVMVEGAFDRQGNPRSDLLRVFCDSSETSRRQSLLYGCSQNFNTDIVVVNCTSEGNPNAILYLLDGREDLFYYIHRVKHRNQPSQELLERIFLRAHLRLGLPDTTGNIMMTPEEELDCFTKLRVIESKKLEPISDEELRSLVSQYIPEIKAEVEAQVQLYDHLHKKSENNS